MKFRRKSAAPDTADAVAEEPTAETTEEAAPRVGGPYDFDEIDDDVGRLDLGSLLVEPMEGLEVRLQVDEAQSTVQGVLLAAADGAVEVRAFAAPRGGDLWSEVRQGIAGEYAQRGGTATAREGRYGTELMCQLTVRTEDGRTGTQPSRVVGINGDRWMVRATFLGRPAVEPDADGVWNAALERLVVRRGSQAMPPGSELPLTLPPAAS